MYAAETILVQMYSDHLPEADSNMTIHNLNNASTPQQQGTNPQTSNPHRHHHNNNNSIPTSCTGSGNCWPTETEGESPAAMMTTAEVTFLAAVMVTVFLCSVVGNVLVCVVFSQRRSSLSLSNRFLANLTVCNCLFTVMVMPLAFTSLLTRRWLLGPDLCQMMGLVVNVLVTASIFTLAVISLDRYCAVVTPLHYTMRMTRKRCGAFIAAIWVAAFLVSFPPLLGWNSFKFHVNKMICTVAWDSAYMGDRYYTLCLVTVSFLVPLMAMLWTYGRIFRAARDNSERTRRSSIVPTVQAECEPCQCTPVSRRRLSSSAPILRRLSQTSYRTGNLLQRREEWKTAVTSFLILFSFMLCWLPYFLVILLRSLAPSLHLHPVVSTFSTAAAMLASACNPIVYVFRSKATRRDLKVILSRGRSLRSEVAQAMRREGSGSVGERPREKGSVFWQEGKGWRPQGACPEGDGGSGQSCRPSLSDVMTAHSDILDPAPNTLVSAPSTSGPSLQCC